jgi:hypothetical protein
MCSRTVIDKSRSIFDDSRIVIDDSTRVMLQLVVSFMIIIYNCHIFIVQATGLMSMTEGINVAFILRQISCKDQMLYIFCV